MAGFALSLAVPAAGLLSSGGSLVACAGATGSLLEEAPPPGDVTADASASNPAPVPDASATKPPKSDDAGTPVVTPDASAPVDTGPPPPSDDAGPPKDSGPVLPPDPGISCGGGLCDPATQVCCLSSNGKDFNCDTQNDCDSSNGLSIPCVKTADCLAAGSPAGTVCCVTAGGGGGGKGDLASDVSCVPESDCQQGQGQAVMCDPGGTDCPVGTVCVKSTLTIPPYSICQ